MAFTEAQLVAQLDSTGTGRTIILETFNPFSATVTDIYAVGVTAPYAGRSRWMQVSQSLSPIQAAAAVQANLA